MQKHSNIWLSWFDWLLIALVVALVCAGAGYVLSSPSLWAWCLDVLDARAWTHWTWTCVVVALLAVLAAIRLWPESGKKGKP